MLAEAAMRGLFGWSSFDVAASLAAAVKRRITLRVLKTLSKHLSNGVFEAFLMRYPMRTSDTSPANEISNLKMLSNTHRRSPTHTGFGNLNRHA